MTGFVPQDDVVHETMTVRENLLFSALLRLPTTTSRPARKEAIRGVLSLLGLSHVANDIVGSVDRKGEQASPASVFTASGLRWVGAAWEWGARSLNADMRIHPSRSCVTAVFFAWRLA